MAQKISFAAIYYQFLYLCLFVSKATQFSAKTCYRVEARSISYKYGSPSKIEKRGINSLFFGRYLTHRNTVNDTQHLGKLKQTLSLKKQNVLWISHGKVSTKSKYYYEAVLKLCQILESNLNQEHLYVNLTTNYKQNVSNPGDNSRENWAS